MSDILDLNNIPKNVLTTDLSSFNFLLYSLPGMGKTTFAVETFDSERTLLLAFEMGAKGIPGARPVPIPDYVTFLKYVDQLDTDEIRAKYDTLIIDTVSRASEYIESYILSMYGKNTIGECGSHGKAYTLINRFWGLAMNRLKARGYNFVYIAHANEEVLKNSNGEEIGKYYTPKLSSRVAGLVEPEVDYTFLITLNQAGERILVTDNTVKCKGKQRTPLPTIMKLDSELFKEEFIKGIKSKSNGEVINERTVTTVVEMANKERDYKELIEEIKSLGNALQEQGKGKEAIQIVNSLLGQDDNGIQRTLDIMTQDNIQVLEVILMDLKKLN